jgi:hypothetical protein
MATHDSARLPVNLAELNCAWPVFFVALHCSPITLIACGTSHAGIWAGSFF